MKKCKDSSLFGISSMQHLIQTAPSLFYIGLVGVFTGHFNQEIEILLPDNELFD
jgi:hypothetical protein